MTSKQSNCIVLQASFAQEGRLASILNNRFSDSYDLLVGTDSVLLAILDVVFRTVGALVDLTGYTILRHDFAARLAWKFTCHCMRSCCSGQEEFSAGGKVKNGCKHG